MDKTADKRCSAWSQRGFQRYMCDCRGRSGTLFANDLLLLAGSWRCGYENGQGFAAKMLRPYEAAYAQIRQRQRRGFLNQLEGELR